MIVKKTSAAAAACICCGGTPDNIFPEATSCGGSLEEHWLFKCCEAAEQWLEQSWTSISHSKCLCYDSIIALVHDCSGPISLLLFSNIIFSFAAEENFLRFDINMNKLTPQNALPLEWLNGLACIVSHILVGSLVPVWITSYWLHSLIYIYISWFWQIAVEHKAKNKKNSDSCCEVRKRIAAILEKKQKTGLTITWQRDSLSK